MNAAPAVRDHIFVSYRREEARDARGRLYDWLRIAFGPEHVFRDVHSIGDGKWRDKIDEAPARSAVCVAVIGPRWANTGNLPRLTTKAIWSATSCSTPWPTSNSHLTFAGRRRRRAGVCRPAPALRPLFDTWNARRVTEDRWEDYTRRLIAEIEKAASLTAKADLDTLLHDVGAAQQRVAELEQARHLHAGQIEGLRRTVEDLTRKLAEAPAVGLKIGA